MRYRWLILTLFTFLTLGRSLAYGQVIFTSDPGSGTRPATALPPSAVPPSNLAPDAPVVTIDGLCGSDSYSIAEPGATSKLARPADSKSAVPQSTTGSAPAGHAGCRTIITRASFEKLASVVAPSQPPQAALQLARLYSQQLVFAHEARELGLDKDPQFDDILKFTYLQVLARAMNTRLQQQSEIPDAEFEKYYKEHPEQFEEVALLQASIPKQKKHATQSGSAPQAKVNNAADEAAMKSEAEKIHRQVLAGGDFEMLQDEAYEIAGDPDGAPDTDMGTHTRSELGKFQKEIFALQPGQISELIEGPEAWHIFKVVSKQMRPQADARKFLNGQRVKAAIESLQNSVKPQYNGAYFGPAAASNEVQSAGGETP